MRACKLCSRRFEVSVRLFACTVRSVLRLLHARRRSFFNFLILKWLRRVKFFVFSANDFKDSLMKACRLCSERFEVSVRHFACTIWSVLRLSHTRRWSFFNFLYSSFTFLDNDSSFAFSCLSLSWSSLKSRKSFSNCSRSCFLLTTASLRSCKSIRKKTFFFSIFLCYFFDKKLFSSDYDWSPFVQVDSKKDILLLYLLMFLLWQEVVLFWLQLIFVHANRFERRCSSSRFFNVSVSAETIWFSTSRTFFCCHLQRDSNSCDVSEAMQFSRDEVKRDTSNDQNEKISNDTKRCFITLQRKLKFCSSYLKTDIIDESKLKWSSLVRLALK